MSGISTCNHDYINPDGSCSQCGIVCSKLYIEETEHEIPARLARVTDRSIAKDIEDLPIPEDVKEQAERINIQLTSKGKRKSKKQQRIFFCLYNAFNTLGQPQDPKKVATMIGMKFSDITRALAAHSEAQTGYHPVSVFSTPAHFIPQYCESLRLNPELTQDALQFTEMILEKDPDLKEKFPQKVAAGILQYYLSIHGIQVNKEEYAKIVDLSVVTINNIYKQIARIHNV